MSQKLDILIKRAKKLVGVSCKIDFYKYVKKYAAKKLHCLGMNPYFTYYFQKWFRNPSSLFYHIIIFSVIILNALQS